MFAENKFILLYKLIDQLFYLFTEQTEPFFHLMMQLEEKMIEKGRTKSEGTILTVEKYISDGKLNRVVIKNDRKNYLLDLPINSFTTRSFLLTAISLVKVFSLVLHDYNVVVVNFTTSNFEQINSE